MSGIFSAATAAALSLSMIGAGVPAGASRPFQPTLMTPGTVSSIVGVSGNSGSRVFSAAPHLRRAAQAEGRHRHGACVLNPTLTLPASRSCIARAVHPSLPVHDVTELIEYARKNPGKLAYATAGIGSSQFRLSD